MNKSLLRKFKLLFIACQENNYWAKVLRFDFLFNFILVFFVIKMLVLPFYFCFPKSIFFAEIISSDIVDLLNDERKALGLNPLTQNSKLSQAAALKAQDMLDYDYFDHANPQGISPWYWIQKVNYDYSLAGENLAIGFLDSEEVHKAWNNSSSHRENLLDPRFKEIGVAILVGEFEGNETAVVVQLFGAPVLASSPNLKEENSLLLDTEPSLIVSDGESFLGATDLGATENNFFPENDLLPKLEENLQEESFGFDAWKFFIKEYDKINRNLVLAAISFLVLILILNLLSVVRSSLAFKSKLLLARNSVLATLLALIALAPLWLINKNLIIQFIPHNLIV